MKIDVGNTLTIILGLLTLIGAIYRLAQVEANINSKISDNESKMLIIVDALKDSLVDKLNAINAKLEIHITKYEGDKEYIYIYRLNDNEKTIEHKFNRLASWITQIAGFLHRKTGFQIRDDKF
ncbi:MAG: hypothetical protein RMY16_13290 [Nostoc sp. DedQUE12b]|uniref:hypothetical protein n=1 Tax=Nostoc sp. DedQUE12b TaxID=3075398 RepID=UPI002AD59B75|nr:hypothetical protein [Nostoc sp. DedQUE12b]MDZ8086513.1 hypothetical protein [Nostoc sp. DedQUE12b]